MSYPCNLLLSRIKLTKTVNTALPSLICMVESILVDAFYLDTLASAAEQLREACCRWTWFYVKTVTFYP